MVERKFLAHYLDANFNASETDYTRLGKDLEEFSENLNPQVDVKKNIIGLNSIHVYGYQPQGEVTPYYVDFDDALSDKIMSIINNRDTGDKLNSSIVDVLMKPGATESDPPTIIWAYKENCVVVPTSMGGNTSGVQAPFTIYKTGERVKGTFDLTTKKFTAG